MDLEQHVPSCGRHMKEYEKSKTLIMKDAYMHEKEPLDLDIDAFGSGPLERITEGKSSNEVPNGHIRQLYTRTHNNCEQEFIQC